MSTEKSLEGYRHWLDPIIRQQAAHYGLTVDQHARLMSGTADVQCQIDTHELTEKEVREASK